jgi:hypothetical protein
MELFFEVEIEVFFGHALGPPRGVEIFDILRKAK